MWTVGPQARLLKKIQIKRTKSHFYQQERFSGKDSAKELTVLIIHLNPRLKINVTGYGGHRVEWDREKSVPTKHCAKFKFENLKLIQTFNVMKSGFDRSICSAFKLTLL